MKKIKKIDRKIFTLVLAIGLLGLGIHYIATSTLIITDSEITRIQDSTNFTEISFNSSADVNLFKNISVMVRWSDGKLKLNTTSFWNDFNASYNVTTANLFGNATRHELDHLALDMFLICIIQNLTARIEVLEAP